MTTTSFREFVPSRGQHPRLGSVDFNDYDIYSWVDKFGRNEPQVRDDLFARYEKLYSEPFRGITAGSQVQRDLFELRDEKAPVKQMLAAATKLVAKAEEAKLDHKLRYDIDANEWRCWMNPEFYYARHGLRLEEIPKHLQVAVLELMKASLSQKGYEDFIAITQLNACRI